MIQEKWISFLQQQGAQISDGLVSSFGDPDAELQTAITATCLYDLSPLGLIRVQGEDAKSFLQNQLSNDINDVTVDHSQLSAYCSAKGRVLSLFRIMADGPGYLLQLPQERLENTLKRLSMFVLMSKVTLSDASADLCTIGISGPEATAVLRTIGVTSALDVNQAYRIDQFTIVRVAGAQPRFILIANQDSLQTFWQANQSQTHPVGYSTWLAMDVNAGLPHVYQATSEAFVPQMLNLNSLEAISYTKGCYPGQEVVARMHYLGKQKRRMYLGQINAEQLPQPGDSLFVDKNISEQSVGSVVHSAINPNGSYDVLAVIQVKHADNDSIFVDSKRKSSLIIKDLPYEVELEGSQ